MRLPPAGLVAKISDSTVWRWLSEDAIRPWQHRCWIFPRDPDFAAKASRILDLYERVFEGQRLKDDEFVLSADEKISIQARARKHPTLPPRPGEAMRVEHEYRRRGPCGDVGAGGVWCAQTKARAPPHRGAACVKRLVEKYPRIVPIHGPIHASWLNQIEIYFSILQRKVLTPNDFPSLEALKERLFAFERHYEAIAKPFEWKFTRQDLSLPLDRIKMAPVGSRGAA